MLRRRVNGCDMAYIELGQGAPLVCVHGSLGDFRTWSPVLGPLSRHHRVIALSLRHFFPAHWDGIGPGFTIAQHVADLISFIEAIGAPVDLLGHSRGGHLAFRLAEQRPDLLRRLILAEPGGTLDASLLPEGSGPAGATYVAEAAAKIGAGDLEGGLECFFDAVDGTGAWRRLPPSERQEMRDNARTLIGQVNEQRQPYSKASAESIRTPTLMIGGSDTQGWLPANLRALARHIPGVRTAIIPGTTHMMFRQEPALFAEAVLEFLS